MNIMSTTLTRVRAGIPSGGEFTSRRRGEPESRLPVFELTPSTDQPTLGKWTVFETARKQIETFGLYELPTGSREVDDARLHLAVAASNTYDRDAAEREAQTLADDGENMTLLILGDDGNVYAYEVTGSENGYLRKGSTTHGWRHGELDILAVTPGFHGQDELARDFESALANC